MPEQWKDIDGYEGEYQVSDQGNVRSLDRQIQFRDGRSKMQRGKVLKLKLNTGGYLLVRLRRAGGEINCLVHRLVAAAFIGQPPSDSHEINHLDGDKANNLPYNLEWCTASQNLTHAYDTGLRKARWGIATGTAKLTTVDVIQAREWHRAGKYDQTEIAKKLGVDRSTISRAVRGENWANL